MIMIRKINSYSNNYSEHHYPVLVSPHPLWMLSQCRWKLEATLVLGPQPSPALPLSPNTIFSPICSSWVTTQWVECVAPACQALPPPFTAGIKRSLSFVVPAWPRRGHPSLSGLSTQIDKIQTKFLIFQIDKWFPGVLILTNVISHNGGWAGGGVFDVGHTGWLVLLEVTHDLHLLMSLYMRDTPVWGNSGTHSNICRSDVSITSLQTFSVLSVVGNVVLLCPPLSSINGKYQQNQSSRCSISIQRIIILLEVNIETFWCSCPPRRLWICEGG